MSAAVDCGYNPIFWDCSKGCYNIKHRAKIEIFAEDLPGKIAMTDVDGVVEVAGYFLFLEFKSGKPREIETGQRLLLQRLTRASKYIVAAIVFGDSEHMTIRAIQVVKRGQFGPFELTTTSALKDRVRKWAAYAVAHPGPSVRA